MKQIHTMCLSCGKKYKKKNKGFFGVWMANCDMCGAKQVACADAQHDFGYYNNNEEKMRDEIQDAL